MIVSFIWILSKSAVLWLALATKIMRKFPDGRNERRYELLRYLRDFHTLKFIGTSPV